MGHGLRDIRYQAPRFNDHVLLVLNELVQVLGDELELLLDVELT